MIAQSQYIPRSAPRANRPAQVTHLSETARHSNIFVCLVPSRSFKRADGSPVVYRVVVRATYYPYSAKCQCPGSHGNCAHKQAAIAAVEAFRTERWDACQDARRMFA
jgi:hypothetical protein